MKTELVASRKGELSRCYQEKGDRIAAPSDFLDLMMSCPTDTIVLVKDCLSADFFDLRSGLAGEILQKVSNYRRRLVVLGEYGGLESRSLRDFIHESNRTGKVVFAPDLEAAIELLR
jgi:hypothetical protein